MTSENLEALTVVNSFLEDSYMKNNLAGSQLRKEETSFDSSTNQIYQSGTPIQYTVKANNIKGP
jgi:hypothetical protein